MLDLTDRHEGERDEAGEGRRLEEAAVLGLDPREHPERARCIRWGTVSILPSVRASRAHWADAGQVQLRTESTSAISTNMRCRQSCGGMGWGSEVSGFDTVTKGSCAPPN